MSLECDQAAKTDLLAAAELRKAAKRVLKNEAVFVKHANVDRTMNSTRFGKILKKSRVEVLFRNYDTNHDGLISWTELVPFLFEQLSSTLQNSFLITS